MHGYEIIQELAERSAGVWRPSPGSVYPTLQMLEDEGLIRGEETGGKRRFTLTDTGRAEAGSRVGPPPWEQATQGVDPQAMALRDSLMQTASAVRQVAMAGNAEQQGKAPEGLADARRKRYARLAVEA
jgi:DNA-binding PadR family transcriptional regulator